MWQRVGLVWSALAGAAAAALFGRQLKILGWPLEIPPTPPSRWRGIPATKPAGLATIQSNELSSRLVGGAGWLAAPATIWQPVKGVLSDKAATVRLTD